MHALTLAGSENDDGDRHWTRTSTTFEDLMIPRAAAEPVRHGSRASREKLSCAPG
jgi:hypothetical protein